MPVHTSKKEAAELLFNQLRKAQARADDERGDVNEQANAKQIVEELKAKLRGLGVDPDPPPPGHNAPPPDAPAPAAPDDPQYSSLVEEGQSAMQQGSHAMWQLGRLASQVHTRYGQHLLQRYADDIGCKYQTLKRCRTTYVAWEAQLGPHGPLPFAVCRALVPLPNRAELLVADPQMTERAALEYARNFRDVARVPPCPLHKLYALLRQPKLLQLADESIANRDEEYGPLRLQAAQHICLVIDRLHAVVAALQEEPQPAAQEKQSPAAAITHVTQKPKRKAKTKPQSQVPNVSAQRRGKPWPRKKRPPAPKRRRPTKEQSSSILKDQA